MAPTIPCVPHHTFDDRLAAALAVRDPLHHVPDLTAYRLVDGAGDDLPGLYLDRYGAAAVLNVYDETRLDDAAVTRAAETVLDQLAPLGVEAVYVKRAARDRSRLGGHAPDETRRAEPRAGRAQPETRVVQEFETRVEVRLYDGFSTGLFLEHREHRRWLPTLQPGRVLNLFAYTCGFAVPLAAAGAHVTNVDVSQRYLDWGRRNAALNAVPVDLVRYHRMDAPAYLAWAARRADTRFDLIVIDPPTFAAADARRGRPAWKALDDYPALLRTAVQVLSPGGQIFAASNTRELAVPGALEALITQALGRPPAWRTLPAWPVDVRERGRVAARLFSPR